MPPCAVLRQRATRQGWIQGRVLESRLTAERREVLRMSFMSAVRSLVAGRLL